MKTISYIRILMVVTGALQVAACGQGKESVEAPVPSLTAASLGKQQVRSASEWLAEEPYASADRKLGESKAAVCRACHTLGPGGANMLGPNLYEFFGRQAASVETFQYSSALANTNFVWTPRALDAWLRQPADFLPGNRMSYPGLPAKRDRDALIAYLLEITSDTEAQK